MFKMNEAKEKFILNAETIEIVSGEGTNGTVEAYNGKRTLRALRMRLTKERCNGDRWAYIKVNGQKIDLEG